MSEIKLLADSVVTHVKDFVARALVPIIARLEAFEQRLNAIPAGPKGDAGERGATGLQGEPGAAGKSIEASDVETMVARSVADRFTALPDIPDLVARAIAEAVALLPEAKDGERGERGEKGESGRDADEAAIASRVLGAIPLPKNGELGARGEQGESGPQGLPGKDFDPAEMHAAIIKAVAEIPKAKDGADGNDANEDAIVERVTARIPRPQDGKSVDAETVRAMVCDEVAKIPRPKDGQSVHPDTVAVMVLDAVEKAVANIELPQDGRDALDIDVVDAVEAGRSYAFGTFAKHRGGIVKALRHTDPIEMGLDKAGWQVVTDGIAEIEIEQDAADPRVIVFGVTLTSGKQTHKHMRCPIVIDRGVFKACADYEKGDGATWDGSFWIAQKETQDKPGTSDAWRLAVKKGRDGKDGK